MNDPMPEGAVAGFSADWLRLREPLDLAARSQALALGFKAALTPRASQALRLIDLAAGSGANFRALAPVLATDQSWLMVDHDPLLLTALRHEIAAWAKRQGWPCRDEAGTLSIDTGSARWDVRVRPLDLARDLQAIDLSACDGLVTTAFLDLVSSAWLDRLCALLAEVPRPLLATLSVDGRRIWHPSRPADPLIAEAFLAHQGGDKGFGPSLGVQAAPELAARLRTRGYQVSTEASDWHVGHDQRELLRTLAHEASAVAMATTAPGHHATVSAWLAEHLAGIEQGWLSLQVGHLDVLAVPEQR